MPTGERYPSWSLANLLEADASTSICLVVSDLTELEAQAGSIQHLRRQQQALEESRVELEAANNALNDSRRAALNVAEDALIARRQAEEAIAELLNEALERKQAEVALKESEERLALALESGRMGLWEWDMRTDRSVWNAVEYRLLGLPVGEGNEATHRFFDRVHPDDIGPFNKILANVMESGGDFSHEVRIIRADDGQERWLAAAGRVIRDAAGQPLKMIGVNYDISERKRAEEALKKLNEELENRVAERTAELATNVEKLEIETEERIQAVEALREKEQMLIQQSRQAAMGEMIGNIAHQWRQPLNTLGLTIQQLLLFYDIE